MILPILTAETAPPESQAVLRTVSQKLGFVPNLLGIMANAPVLLQAYLQLAEIFRRSSLSATEQQVVLLTVSERNQCEYCVAAHGMTAKQAHLPDEIIAALSVGAPLSEPRLEALRAMTAVIVERRGWPTAEAIAGFENAGFRREQVLDVILGVGMKTLSNYTNHVAHTPLDPQFGRAN